MKRVGESQAVAEKTRLEEEQERERNIRRKQFLSTFKDTNKMVRAHSFKTLEAPSIIITPSRLGVNLK